MVKNVFGWIGKLLLGYLIIGCVYYFSGRIYNLVIGKQETFSMIIGLPLTLIGWLQSIRADFIHREMLGIKPPLIFTTLSILAVMVWLLRDIFKHAKNK